MNPREAILFEATSPTGSLGSKAFSPSRLALFGSFVAVLIVLAFQGCKAIVDWVGRDAYHRLDFRDRTGRTAAALVQGDLGSIS